MRIIALIVFWYALGQSVIYLCYIGIDKYPRAISSRGMGLDMVALVVNIVWAWFVAYELWR